MKKILVGLANNISSNKQKIKVWAESFKKYSDGEVTLLAANASDEDLNICKELNIKYYSVTVDDIWYINHKRLEHTASFLKQSDGDLFLITDVFDVIFQSDPFDKFDLINYDTFISTEGVLVNEEPWNADVIRKVFPSDINLCLPTEIVCSGVIGGKRESLIRLYEKMFFMCENSLNGHNIKDQAALIILVAKNEIDKLKIFNIDDGWAMHCATSGPTEFFEKWGLKNSLSKRYGIPILVDNKVYTADHELYDIVHQFNRIPDWHVALTKDY